MADPPNLPWPTIPTWDRAKMWKYCVEQKKASDGMLLEFGVFAGRSMSYWSSNFKPRTVYGFDSFEGLPEKWVRTLQPTPGRPDTHPKGHFRMAKLPELSRNVILVKGWFSETLPKWVLDHEPFVVDFIHIDSDLYSSAKTILHELSGHCIRGTLILFDELFGYDAWAIGEWKALNEWEKSFLPIAKNDRQGLITVV